MIDLNAKFEIFGFRAIDEPDLCTQYIKGHKNVLKAFSLNNVSSCNERWVTNPNVYCLGLRATGSEGLLGGIRIQLADTDYHLPLTEALGKIAPEIYDLIHYYSNNGGVAELSALWVNSAVKKFGMSPYLVRGAVAASSQLNFKKMVGISAEHPMKMFNNVGFTLNPIIHQGQGFPYPNIKYTTYYIDFEVLELRNADIKDKRIILDLRENPTLIRNETEGELAVRIKYNLNIHREQEAT